MSPPWMPLYIADYRKDTAHLSAAEHGAYLNMIMHYWATGALPNDDRQLARIACMSPSEWKRARTIVQAFFHDGWRHKRIDAELVRAAEVSESYAARASKAAKTRWEKHASSNASDDVSSMLENAHSPSPSPKKEQIAPDGAPDGNGKYAFESGLIRLTAKDLAKWQKGFSYLDLQAELISLTRWAGEQGPDNWFFAVSGALAKRNRDEKMRREKPAGARGASLLDGIT